MRQNSSNDIINFTITILLFLMKLPVLVCLTTNKIEDTSCNCSFQFNIIMLIAWNLIVREQAENDFNTLRNSMNWILGTVFL